MPTYPRPLTSRLPEVGTTIFSVMSALAQQHGALNLSQGFPDFDAPAELLSLLDQHARTGHNQYAPMTGVPVLREAIAAKVSTLYGAQYDVDAEITVTAGATQAIFTAVAALVHPGDEVIVFTPVYDSYAPSVELQGGKVVYAHLTLPDYRPDWDEVARLITPRTRMIILNSPHNPTGTVWTAEDMAQLEALVKDTDIVLLSDEVYEHMVFDGQQHQSAARFPGLAARAFIVSSFGKTYHVTGWKVGYVAAPAALMAEFRKVHQFNVFTVNTPMQYGLAAYMQNPAPYLELPAFYDAKRQLFRDGLANTKLRLLPCEGTYFQCVSIADLAVPERDLPDADFCQWLTREIGVAAIPLSAFYGDGFDQKVIRFCFAKKDETLVAALERLASL